MGDPNFERSVILLVQHGPDGALGLVLNQPTGASVRDAVAMAEDVGDVECETQEGLYRGGPCEGPLMVLHGDALRGQERVLEGVYFSTDREFVEPALSGDLQPVRFFAGYSGWGAGQLEGELAAGAWVVLQADASVVFEPSGDPWRALIRVKKSSELLKQFGPQVLPKDPSMN